MLVISDCILTLLVQTELPRSIELDSMRTTQFYFFCGLGFLLFLVRTLFAKDWSALLESFRSAALAKTQHFQDQLPFTIAWVLLLLFSAGVMSSLYLGIQFPEGFHFKCLTSVIEGATKPSYWLLLLYPMLLIFAAIALRLLWLSAFSFLLPVRKEAGLYVKTVAIYTIFLGFALLPIALFQAFGPDIPRSWINWSIVTIYAIFVILRIFRGFSISKPFLSIRIDYIIAYFCALEILPILLILKASRVI